MKKKLELMIAHIIEKSGTGECDCRLCANQEYGTFLSGLQEALSLIPKRQ